MTHRMYYRLALAGVLAALAVTPGSAAAQTDFEKIGKEPKDRWAAKLNAKIKPGKTIRWRSPRIGVVEHLRARVNGGDVTYEVEPRTNECVAYIYGRGVAVRLTDCVRGRRVKFVRVTATNLAAKPRRLALWFSTDWFESSPPVPGPPDVPELLPDELLVDGPVPDAWGRPPGDPCHAIDPTIPINGEPCSGWAPEPELTEPPPAN